MNAIAIPQAAPLTAAEIIDKLRTLYGEVPPDVDQRTAAYWWGKPDDSVAWWLATCRMIAPHPIAQSLYLAHVAEDMSQRRAIKDWAYEAAAKFASGKGTGPRRRAVVESYRADWGHQAARDGVFLALWGDLEDVPGITFRCGQFGCGKQAYQRVRDDVQGQAKDLIAGFRADMEVCRTGKYNRWFTERWERATEKSWVWTHR